MANNYYQATGIVYADKATPVLKALFEAYEFCDDFPGKGEFYINIDYEMSVLSFECGLYNALADLAIELKLEIPPVGEEAQDMLKDTIRHLEYLATHFNTVGTPEYRTLIDALPGMADDVIVMPDALYRIARVLDDGHGIMGVAYQGAWTCSKPRLDNFGGDTTVAGNGVTFYTSTSPLNLLGKELIKPENIADPAKLAGLLYPGIDQQLSPFTDETYNAPIKKAVAYRLLGQGNHENIQPVGNQ